MASWDEVNYTSLDLIRAVSDSEATSNLGMAEKSTLKRLIEFIDPDGYCWPSADVVANGVGCTDRTARDAINALIKNGFLERQRRKTTPLYRVNIDLLRPEEFSSLKTREHVKTGKIFQSRPEESSIKTGKIFHQDRKNLPVNRSKNKDMNKSVEQGASPHLLESKNSNTVEGGSAEQSPPTPPFEIPERRPGESRAVYEARLYDALKCNQPS